MSSKLLSKSPTLSLSVRLTLWYTTAFAVCLTAMFAGFYYQLKAAAYRTADGMLLQEMGELREGFSTRGLDYLTRQLQVEAREIGTNKAVFRIVDGSGAEIASSERVQWESLPIELPKVDEALRLKNKAVLSTQKVPPGVTVRTLYLSLGNGLIINGIGSLAEEMALLHRYRVALALGGLLVVILAAFVGYFMARSATSRVKELTQTALRIHEGRLDDRVPIRAVHDEIDHLGLVFNGMLNRIQNLVRRMKQMMDDIAHELRSPITRIRGNAELALLTPSVSEDTRNLAAATIEELDKMLSLVNTMLDISEADADVSDPRTDTVNIRQLLLDAVELFEPVAEQKNIALRLSDIGEFVRKGNKQKLQRAIANILDNAIKYTPPGGTISVYRPANDPDALVIEDNGIGIAAEDVPHVFERFYRSPAVGSEAGSGLGLSLTQSVVRAHGGEIFLSSRLGEGTQVHVHLPA